MKNVARNRKDRGYHKMRDQWQHQNQNSVHRSLVEHGKTIIAEVYSQLFDRVKVAFGWNYFDLEKKKKKILFTSKTMQRHTLQNKPKKI